MSKKKIISLTVSVILTIGLLTVLILNISIAEISKTIDKINLKWIFIAFGFHLCSYIFRTIMMFLLFRKHKISFILLLQTHFIHNFYVHLIPASLGELSFPILLKKHISTKESISGLIVARLFLLFISLLAFTISLIFALESFSLSINKIYIIVFISVILLISIFFLRKKIMLLLNKISILKKIKDNIISVYLTIKQYINNLKSINLSLKLFLFSILNFFGFIGFYCIILHAIGINLSIWQVVFVSSIGLAFILLPIKSIGGFGTTEGSWTIGLMLFGVLKETAIEAGFVIHIFALINVIILFFVGIIMKFLIKTNQKTIK